MHGLNVRDGMILAGEVQKSTLSPCARLCPLPRPRSRRPHATQVGEFLPYSVGLNPAIVSAVETEMREPPVVEATREAGVEEAKTGGSTG